MFAGVLTGLEELRRDMTNRIDRVEERAHRGQEKLRDELTHVKSQARVHQAQFFHNTDQCLAESLTQAKKESEERESRITREIKRLMNDHDNTYAHTMTSLETRLDAKSDLMMRKLDEILSGSNREECSAPRERSRQANDGDGPRRYAGPSKVREQVTNLSTGSGPGQPLKAKLDKPGLATGGCHTGDKIAHCATSQINARSDYDLTGHNDIRFDV